MKIKENKGSQTGHTKKKNIQKNIKTFLKKKKKKKKKTNGSEPYVSKTLANYLLALQVLSISSILPLWPLLHLF
jgi:hypothetical protein